MIIDLYTKIGKRLEVQKNNIQKLKEKYTKKSCLRIFKLYLKKHYGKYIRH